MKKVEFDNEMESISINSLKDTNFIGTKIIDSSIKGHILKIDTNQYVINTVCSNNSYVGKMIFDSISNALNYYGIEKVFVFKSRKELLKWMIS